MPAFARILCGVFLLVSGPIIWAMMAVFLVESKRPVWMELFQWETYMAAVTSAAGITYLWWHRQVRVCDQGVVVRHQLKPWDDMQRWYWDACNKNVAVLVFHEHGQVPMIVPPEEREAVAAYLKGKLSLAVAINKAPPTTTREKAPPPGGGTQE
jgi:hypothetical protein